MSGYHGLLVIDKPAGMTSRDVVNRVQRWFPRGTKIGHTGTLDPLATGVLVICVGAATRLAEYVQAMDKEYVTAIALDRRSNTDDADGIVEQMQFASPDPTREQVAACVNSFVGEIDQTPPGFSALKVGGKRAYSLARKGELAELAPRRIHVYELDILEYHYPSLKLRIRCGKGTYVRSLARDIGAKLGRAGMVLELRRKRIGPFHSTQAIRLDTQPAAAVHSLLPLSAAVRDLPKLTLNEEKVRLLAHGQLVELAATPAEPDMANRHAAIFAAGDNRLVAIALVHADSMVLKAVKVLSSTSEAS